MVILCNMTLSWCMGRRLLRFAANCCRRRAGLGDVASHSTFNSKQRNIAHYNNNKKCINTCAFKM